MADAKKCDRCGNYYDKNEKHETVGRISGEVVVGIGTIGRNGHMDKYFDLCDTCIGSFKKFTDGRIAK